MAPNTEDLRRLPADELLAIARRQQALLDPPPEPAPSALTRLRPHLPWLTLAAVTLLAEVILRAFDVPSFILPRPSAVFVALATKLPYLSTHLWITLGEILVGFLAGAAIGVALAALVTHKPILQDIVAPYILFLLTMPMVSLVPLLSLQFGFGSLTKMIVVGLATFPVVMINSATGLMRVEGPRLDLMRTLRASELDTFLHVRVPGALPHIFTGLTLGIVFAAVTAVASEFVGGTAGLGNRLAYHAGLLQSEIVFAIILMLALVSFGLYRLVQWVGQRVVSWQE